jgi:methylenetetrahydrofolate--tRNA-(uracil-5-)-methyltransferase
MISGLIAHLVESDPKHFQPMNSNFGLLPRPTVKAPSKKRKELQAEEALRACAAWVADLADC